MSFPINTLDYAVGFHVSRGGEPLGSMYVYVFQIQEGVVQTPNSNLLEGWRATNFEGNCDMRLLQGSYDVGVTGTVGSADYLAYTRITVDSDKIIIIDVDSPPPPPPELDGGDYTLPGDDALNEEVGAQPSPVTALLGVGVAVGLLALVFSKR